MTSSLWQTNTTIIELPGRTVVIDPTYYPAEVAAVRQRVDAIGQPIDLILTHSDWDHIVGFPQFTDATVYAHTNVARKTDDAKQKIVEEIASFDGKWYVDRPEPCVYPRVDVAIEHDTEHTIAGESVMFIPVPGHTDDMIATIFLDRQVVVAGDLLSALEFPFIYHSFSAYRKTLQWMRAFFEINALPTLIPGHGPPATSLDEILRRLDDDQRYLDDLEAAVRRGSDGSDVRFRGETINPHIAPFHVDNVTLVRQELA